MVIESILSIAKIHFRRNTIRCLFIIIMINTFFGISYGAKLYVEPGEDKLLIFFTEESKIGQKAILKGLISEIGAREFSTEKEKELGQSIQDRTKALIRLVDAVDIIPGNTLYVVNERNLIVARLSILTVFKSSSFEMMCVGYGNFRVSKQGYRVVQVANDDRSTDASGYCAKGNYYYDMGDQSKAIEYYQKSIGCDKTYPEAHSALGYIYLEQKLIPFAMKEFDIAYQYRARVYDKEELYLILKGSVESRYTAAFRSELPKGNKIRERYVDEGIRLANEAIKIYPESLDAHFYLGSFYYDRSTSDLTRIETENDKLVKDEMLKVLSFKEDHTEANMILAKLYRKHQMKEIALKFAEKAVSSDPKSIEARDLKKAIEKMK
jgi:hypothetical protein